MSEPQLRWRQRLESLQRALGQLKAALLAHDAAPESEVIGMAVIKAYEFSFELSWKTLKDWLSHEGIDALVPREVLRPHGSHIRRQPSPDRPGSDSRALCSRPSRFGQGSGAKAMTEMAEELGGLPARTLEEIASVMGRFRDIRWVKLYGSRALGRHRPGSDIDLAFSAPIDHTAALAGALEELPTPYRFDVTHWETLEHAGLREHIARWGVPLLCCGNGNQDDAIRHATPAH
jgi:predicted nucleotidyltransferase